MKSQKKMVKKVITAIIKEEKEEKVLVSFKDRPLQHNRRFYNLVH